MNNIATIEALVRCLINDEVETTADIFVYNGSSSVFTLTEASIVSVDEVMVNDTTSGVTYSVDGVEVDVTSSLTMDDVVEIEYSAYKQYSSTEILAYIKSALVHLSLNNIKTYKIDSTNIYPVPTDGEANLIAMIASIIINPQNISYRMPDINVSVPKELPTLDKIRKVISIYKKSGPGMFFIAEDKDNLFYDRR